METRILAYVDGRLKESERIEMEKHLDSCSACSLRVNEFRAVGDLLDELPVIEPSGAFNARVHALVAAEPRKRSSWLAWLAPSPRVAFAASLLLLAIVWMGARQPPPHSVIGE
jgi:anti-sigma factor RsiW